MEFSFSYQWLAADRAEDEKMCVPTGSRSWPDRPCRVRFSICSAFGTAFPTRSQALAWTRCSGERGSKTAQTISFSNSTSAVYDPPAGTLYVLLDRGARCSRALYRRQTRVLANALCGAAGAVDWSKTISIRMPPVCGCSRSRTRGAKHRERRIPLLWIRCIQLNTSSLTLTRK